MAERIAEVGIPPSIREEVNGYLAGGDPVAKDMLDGEFRVLRKLLTEKGYIKNTDNLLVRFVSDPCVSTDSPTRPVKIFEAEINDDGFRIGVGDPIDVLNVKAIGDGQN